MERNYIEIIEGSLSNRGNFLETKFTKIFPRHMEAYTSMFVYPDSAMSFILTNISEKTNKPSVTGYEGEVGIRSIYIDIDMESAPFDIRVAELKRVMNILEVQHGLTKDNYQLFFSGNKGWHIVLPLNVFSDKMIFSERAFEIARMFVCELIDIPYEEGKMTDSTVDFKTIHNTAVFRLPLSKHLKTGAYKIPINDVDSLTEELLLKMAKNCEYSQTFLTTKFKRNEKLEMIFNSCIEKVKNTPIASVSITQVKTNKSSIFRVPGKSERNHELHRMAYRLFSLNALKDNEVWDIMSMIHDLTNRDSFNAGIDLIPEPEFKKLMLSANSKGKQDWIGEKTSITDTAEAVTAGFEFLKNNTRIPTYIKTVDDKMGGLLCGCSYAVIGKNRTKKSRVWMRAAMENARAGIPTVYYSGEMSEVQLSFMMIEYEFGIDVESEFRLGNIGEAQIATMILQLSKTFEMLKFICKGDITDTELEKSIKDIEKMISKKVRFVILDSIGSLKYLPGGEIPSLIEYSKRIKELAKKLMACFITLNHVSGMCTFSERNPSNFARGGGKILDNCDGYFEHSLISDSNNMSAKEIYHDDLVYMHYTSKRDKVKTEPWILKMDNCKVISEHDADKFDSVVIINQV
jgi:KaiC/GvpD/RAD55 family RecA-like ATPase